MREARSPVLSLADAPSPLRLGRWIPLDAGDGVHHRLPASTREAIARAHPTELWLPRLLAAENMLLVAPPGAGKSVDIIGSIMAYALRPLDRWTQSLFFWDPSGELAKKLGGLLDAVGFHVLELHPYARKERVNPLAWIGGYEWVREFWQAWFANSGAGIGGSAGPFYHDLTLNIVVAATLAMQAEKGCAATLCDVFDLFAYSDEERALGRRGDHDGMNQGYIRRVGDVLARADDGGVGSMRWSRMCAATNTFENGRSSLTGRLDSLGSPRVRHFVGANDLDVRAMLGGERPTAVFYQLPTALQEAVAPLTGAVLATLFGAIGEYSDGGALPRGCVFILDETGSGATIYKLPGALNTLRKADVAVVVVVQEMAQLEEKYSRAGAAQVKGACGLWVGMGGMEMDDCAAFSRRLGTQRIRRDVTRWEPATPAQRAADPARDWYAHPQGASYHVRALIEEHEIRTLPRWVRLVVPRDRHGLLTVADPWFEDDVLAQAAGWARTRGEEADESLAAGHTRRPGPTASDAHQPLRIGR